MAEQIIRSACGGMEWYSARLHVATFVVLPNASIDAINFVGPLANIIQKAVGVDDKWHTLSLSWRIDKHNPFISISLSQIAKEDHAYCPGCNREMGLSNWYPSMIKRRKDGRSTGWGVCRNCKKRQEKDRHQRNRALAKSGKY